MGAQTSKPTRPTSKLTRPSSPSDSELEKLPTEILLKIMKSLHVSDISIAFTCPRMYELFKDVFPRPISLCNTGVTRHLDHLDPSKAKKVHLKLQKFSRILSVYEPKDYIYRVVTRVCDPAGYDLKLGILYRYEHYGRFLRRPYYDEEANCQDLKDKYRSWELFVQCWAKNKCLPKEFIFPYPHNKGRLAFDMEMKDAINILFDSMVDANDEEYSQRLFFMKMFLRIGTNGTRVNDLVTANMSLIHFSQFREMTGL